MRVIILAFAAVFSISAADAQVSRQTDLNRPRLSKGDQVLSQSLLLMENGKLTMKSEKGDVTVPMTVSIREATLEEVVATGPEGQVIEASVQVIVSLTSRELTLKDGDKEQIQRDSDLGPLTGLKLKYKQHDDKWQGNLETGETPVILKPHLEGYSSSTENVLLPAHSVKPGDKWTVSGASFRRILPDAIKLNGKAECEYVKVIQRKGRDHALIQWSLELEAVSLDPDNNESKIRMGLSGQSWYEISSGIEAESKGKGSMITEAVVDGEPVKVAGPVVLEATQQRFRILKD